MNPLRRKAWSPYAAGIVIGLLQIPALLIIDSPLGASSSFVSAAGWLASLVDADVARIDYFNKYMTSVKYAWQSALVIGVAVGALLSSRLSGARRQAFSPAWREAVGVRSLGPRMLMAFAGGFVLLFGARWAGG
jgi:hypothetical protein